MRVVVYPHRLEIGGSQINAIELAGAVSDLGHEVIVFGQPGGLVERVRDMGLEYVAAPRPTRPPLGGRLRPGPARRAATSTSCTATSGRRRSRRRGPRATRGVPAVATVMSMAVAPFLPLDMPLVVGTEQIADHERRAGRRAVEVIEPPVDVARNAPDAVDAAAFAAEHGLDADALTVVCVSRLAPELKLEGLLTAVEVAGRLAPGARAARDRRRRAVRGRGGGGRGTGERRGGRARRRPHR